VLENSAWKPELAGPDVACTPLNSPQCSHFGAHVHPSGTGTHTSLLIVEGKMLKYCGGEPTPMEIADQLPSLPTQIVLAGKEYGAGRVLVGI
jgi:hypothetical protein